jgi:hypothetical protein
LIIFQFFKLINHTNDIRIHSLCSNCWRSKFKSVEKIRQFYLDNFNICSGPFSQILFLKIPNLSFCDTIKIYLSYSKCDFQTIDGGILAQLKTWQFSPFGLYKWSVFPIRFINKFGFPNIKFPNPKK